jgi:hypothetical protein
MIFGGRNVLGPTGANSGTAGPFGDAADAVSSTSNSDPMIN